MFTAAVLALLIGLALAAAGRRGWRTDDHPLCRRCRFDLTGRPAGSTRCPECGADLSRRRAVVVGRRRVRPAVLAGGVMLVVLSLATGGVVEYGRTRHVNWLAHAPLWYVLREAASADAGRRTPALAEVTARTTAGRLSGGDWDRVADAGLAYQGDAAKPWDAAWGNWLERARANGHLSDDRWRTYARQAVAGTLAVRFRPAIAHGDPLPFDVLFDTGRAATTSRLVLLAQRPRLRWPDGTELRPFDWGVHNRVGCYNGYSGVLPAEVVPAGLTGRAIPVTIVDDCDVGEAAGTDRPTRLMPATVTGTAGVDVLPAGGQTVRVVADAQLDGVVRRAFAVRLGRTGTPATPGRLGILVGVSTAPVPLAMDVLIRLADGREVPVGDLEQPAGPVFSSGLGFGVADPAPTAATVDVVFRSNPSLAKQTIDVTSIWGGEVVLRNVPVTGTK